MLTNTQIRLSILPTIATDFGSLAPSLPASINLANGTSANQADLIYFRQRSVTSGTPDSIDLSGGGLLQPDQSACDFFEVVALLIYNTSTTATLTVGGGSNAVANISGTVGPGGYFVVVAPANPGYPVTAGTADILQVTADSGTAVYDIMVVGRSA